MSSSVIPFSSCLQSFPLLESFLHHIRWPKYWSFNFSISTCGSAGKESACNMGDLGSTPGLGRSPGEGKGYPLQYSGLKNSMDYTVHGVAKSRTRLNDFHSLPMNIQDRFPLGFTGLIFLHSKGHSRVFYNTTAQKHPFFGAQLSLSHPCMTTGETIALTGQTFVSKVMTLVVNMLSRLVIAFLPKSKHLLVS